MYTRYIYKYIHIINIYILYISHYSPSLTANIPHSDPPPSHPAPRHLVSNVRGASEMWPATNCPRNAPRCWRCSRAWPGNVESHGRQRFAWGCSYGKLWKLKMLRFLHPHRRLQCFFFVTTEVEYISLDMSWLRSSIYAWIANTWNQILQV